MGGLPAVLRPLLEECRRSAGILPIHLHEMQQTSLDSGQLLLSIPLANLGQRQSVAVRPEAVGCGEAHEEARVPQEFLHARLELGSQVVVEPVVLDRLQKEHPFERWGARVAQVLRKLCRVVCPDDLWQGPLQQPTDRGVLHRLGEQQLDDQV